MTVPDPAACGERIEHLLEASAAGGPLARERAEELVRTVVDLYGAGLERVLEILHEADALDDAVVAALAGDPLVASLLLVHGLHPYGVEYRVEQALEQVQASLGRTVTLLSVTDGVVRVRRDGGCGSSTIALQQAVEDAILAAAPEVSAVEVESEPAVATLIPTGQLMSRLHPNAVGA